MQISLDGATAEVNDAVRGAGSYATALRPCSTWPRPASRGFKISVVVTRQNVGQLDDFKAIADRFGAQLRLTRLRPSGRGADVWDELHPTADAAAPALRLAGRPRRATCSPATRSSTWPRYGEPLPGLNLCGAGRVVCLIDPVGDVYACPFAIHDNFLAGNVRGAGGFAAVWRDSELFARAARAAVRRRLRVVLGLRRLPRRLHGGQVLHRPAARRPRPRVRARARRAAARRRARSPRAPAGHSTTRTSVPVPIGLRRPPAASACDESPLAGLRDRRGASG